MGRPIARLAALAAMASATLVFVSLPLPMDAAAPVWQLAPPTTTVNGPSTKVSLTITNVGPAGPSFAIGCVKVSIPAAAAVSADAIEPVTPGKSWVSSLATGSPSLVTAHAKTNTDWLDGGTVKDSVHIAITVKPIQDGATDWTIDVFRTKNCTSPSDTTKLLHVTVAGAPKPTPTPKPTPKPTATPTPKPTATLTPKPTATPSPKPTATPTPTPTPIPVGRTPAPPAGPTPTPGSIGPIGTPVAPTPTPSGATPSVSASPDPSSTAAPSTGGGAIVPPPAGGPTGGGPGNAGIDTFTLGAIGDTGDSGSNQIGAAIDHMGSLGMAAEWGVPAIVMSVPGLLIVLIVVAQGLGGAAWLPLVRRRIGGFGLRGPRSAGRA